MKIAFDINCLHYKPLFPVGKIIRTRGIINDNSLIILWLSFTLIITWKYYE